MKKQALMALYGGSAGGGGDQETREEYNARKKRSKPKAKVLETAFVILDAADRREETVVVPPRVEEEDSSEEDLPRRRVSSESESEEEDVDSDGDVKARRRVASSSSSSESEEEKTAHGLKQSHEFPANTTSTAAAARPSAQTVFRDKKTGLVTQPPTKDNSKDEDALLEFELNMGSMDKLRLRGGVAEDKSAKADLLEEMDPMAPFLSRDKKRDGSHKEQELTDTGKPKFKGAQAAPTRFGTSIPPGYRWDGVDRSNGFERQVVRSRAAV